MILHNKSLYALVTMMVISVSLQANDLNELKKGNKKLEFRDGKLVAVELNKKEEVLNFGQHFVMSGIITFASNAMVNMLMPDANEDHKKIALLGLAGVLNGLHNITLSQELIGKDLSKWKDKKTWKTLVAVASGQAAAMYGPGLAQSAVDKFGSSNSGATTKGSGLGGSGSNV